ncbi:hypothetical protein Tco_0729091 [Tanacetum coccineum]|uniref:Uncharacterized protein n=1 Tax=Tanacetum coccineum TaxID=301880 RepID=A0ABQ4YQE2_9ASTR
MSSYSIPHGSTRDPISSTCSIIQINKEMQQLWGVIDYALTAIVDVPAVYLQQFWRMVRKLIIADLMKKFPNIPKRIEEDYHSITDDVPLIRVTDDFKEYETVFMKTAKESSSLRKSLKITIKQKQIVEKDDDDSKDMIEPESHKENHEFVDDCDDKEEEKHNDDMDRANDIVLWEALRQDDAPPEREKRVKRSKKSKRSKSAREDNVIDEDEVIPKDETPELIAEFHNIDKRVPTIFDHARMEATLRDTLSNQYKNAEEYAYHSYGNIKEKKYNFSLYKIHAEEFPKPDLEEKIKKVVRIVTDQPSGLDFMDQILVMGANDKPDSFSEADFKYLNKKDIEDLYYVCRSKKVDNQKIKLMNSLITFIRSCVIWERVHDFQLGIKSYQIKVNLTAPTLTFPGIEEHAPYSIVDEPDIGLIYLNNKDEKRVMYLVEIVKFCDATLEKVLKGVKLRMFESKFLKKLPLLGDLDQDIMKAYEREICMRLSH